MTDTNALPLAPRPSSLEKDRFIAAYGGIYEHSPWVAEAVWPKVSSGALDNAETLHAEMQKAVDSASNEARMAIIRAHPDLAGKAAIAGALSKQSTAEQTGAGLDRLDPDQYTTFKTLNQNYKARFGFPFVIAVRGLNADDIIDAFRSRLTNSLDDEFKTALAEVHKIAGLRLQAMTR